jgi:Rieske Fe-S protein
LLVAGAGGVLSADAWLAQRAAARPGVAEDRTRRIVLAAAVAVAGAMILDASALFRSGKKKSAAGGSPGPTQSASSSAPGATSGSAAAPSSKASTKAPTGPVLTEASDVPVGGAHKVTDSDVADTVWVTQLQSGQFKALDGACPHQGCAVDFVSAGEGFRCPCHQSRFDANGKVLTGPASSDLRPIAVVVDGKDIRST